MNASHGLHHLPYLGAAAQRRLAAHLDLAALRRIQVLGLSLLAVAAPGLFWLAGHPRDPRPAYVEVKSVTLARGRMARFPDSVTARGRRHLEVLAALRAEGARACLLFVVQRSDCDAVEPADEIDPAYGRTLRAAAAAGVELLALRVRVSPRALAPDRMLPVRL